MQISSFSNARRCLCAADDSEGGRFEIAARFPIRTILFVNKQILFRASKGVNRSQSKRLRNGGSAPPVDGRCAATVAVN